MSRTISKPIRIWMLVVCTGWLTACAPAWNWRQLLLPGAELAASFPCKPHIKELQGTGLAVCENQGSTFSLAWQDLERGDRVLQALETSAAQLAARLQLAVQSSEASPAVPVGAVAARGSGAWRLGAPTKEALLLTWGRGTRVYQAVVQGPHAQAEEAVPFWQGLRHPGPEGQ